MPEDNNKKIKDLGLRALLEQGNVDKFFDVQFKEKETDSKSQLIGSIARIADMVTQHSEGVFVEEISQRLSEKMAEMAEQLAKGLDKDLQGAEKNLRAFVEATDETTRTDLLAELTSKVMTAEANLRSAVESQLKAALPELAESARLTDDELQELTDNAALSVESQMSDILGNYFATNSLTPDEIEGFKEAVQSLIPKIDFSKVEIDWKQIKKVPPEVAGGGKNRLKFMADVNFPGMTDGQVLAYNATTKNFDPTDADSLPDQTGNSGKYLTTDGTTPSWATLAGGGDMAAATYDPAGITEQLVGLTATQTLTNKTIDADNNTITNIALGAEATGALGDLSDVTETTVANGEVLWYSTGWKNGTLAEAGIQGVLAEGAFVDGDKTKLDGIETGADVTANATVDGGAY